MTNFTSTDYITKHLKLCPPIINAICTQSLKVVHQSACKQKLVPIITSNIMFSCRFCGFTSELARSCSVHVGPYAQKTEKERLLFQGDKLTEKKASKKEGIVKNHDSISAPKEKDAIDIAKFTSSFFKRKICANSVSMTM